jgi:hypothetical protein
VQHAGIASLVEAVLDWCKTSLADCRRPYGIDHFDLAIAFRFGESRVQKQYFKGLRPLNLYQDELSERLRLKLSEGLSSGGDALLVSAAFFSWGEAVSHALV